MNVFLILLLFVSDNGASPACMVRRVLLVTRRDTVHCLHMSCSLMQPRSQHSREKSLFTS